MNQENQLQSIIELIEKTGDKAIVLDKGRPAYVMMRLKDYEGLILGKAGVRGLTEEELLDKINREIAVWKSDQEMLKEIEEEELTLPKKGYYDWEGDSDEDDNFMADDLMADDFEAPFLKEKDDFDASEELKKYRFGSSADPFEENKYYVEPLR